MGNVWKLVFLFSKFISSYFWISGFSPFWYNLQWSLPPCQSHAQHQESWPVVLRNQPGLLHSESDISWLQSEHPDWLTGWWTDQLCHLGLRWLEYWSVSLLFGGPWFKHGAICWQVHPLSWAFSSICWLQLLVQSQNHLHWRYLNKRVWDKPCVKMAAYV